MGRIPGVPKEMEAAAPSATARSSWREEGFRVLGKEARQDHVIARR